MMKEMRITNRRQMLGRFLRGSGRFFGLSVFFAALTSLFDLINPRLIGFAADAIVSRGGEESWRNPSAIAGLVALCAVLGAMCRYFFKLYNSKGAEKLVQTMRNDLFEQLEHLPFVWYEGNQTGDLIQRCTSDVETLKSFLADQLTSVVRIVLMLALALSFMAGIDLPLTLMAGAFVPMIFCYSLFFHRHIGMTFLKADEEEGKLSSITQENLTGVRVVRAFGRERAERDKFARQNDIYTAAYMKLAVLISAFWSMGDFFSGLQVMLVVAAGACACVTGRISAGDYLAFVSYNAMLAWPVRTLGRVISDMSKAGVSVDRILYIMEAEWESDPPDAVTPPMDREIAFRHVSFQYGERGGDILQDIDFTIRPGETFGILGGTGSGKTTLMLLLERLYELDEGQGQITVGGTDIRKIRLSWLRGNIGMVLQEPFLFSRTIGENIAIAGHQAGDIEIRRAAGMASLDETISRFKRGYDTFVGERGVSLSGGQKQRTAIAQLLLRNTPVMVFDDSLSAVDAETDAVIRDHIRQMSGKVTVILISHRISTLESADRILVLNGGRIAQLGTPAELSAEDGIYRSVSRIQKGEEA